MRFEIKSPFEMNQLSGGAAAALAVAGLLALGQPA